jgi:hypothetical protein
MNKKNVLLFCIFLMLVLFFSTFAEAQPTKGTRAHAKFVVINDKGVHIRFTLDKYGNIEKVYRELVLPVFSPEEDPDHPQKDNNAQIFSIQNLLVDQVE